MLFIFINHHAQHVEIGLGVIWGFFLEFFSVNLQIPTISIVFTYELQDNHKWNILSS